MGLFTYHNPLLLKRKDISSENLPKNTNKITLLNQEKNYNQNETNFEQKLYDDTNVKQMMSIRKDSSNKVEYRSNKSEKKLNERGNVIQIRQLPCKTFISCGDCPYRDKCCYIHDITLASKSYNSINNIHNTDLYKNDSFFWKPMPYELLQKQYSVDKGDIFQPYKPSEPHAKSRYAEYAVQSMWTNLSTYCKELEEQRDITRERNTGTRKQGFSHQNKMSAQVEEVRIPQHDDASVMKRCPVFVQLSKGQSILPIASNSNSNSHSDNNNVTDTGEDNDYDFDFDANSKICSVSYVDSMVIDPAPDLEIEQIKIQEHEHHGGRGGNVGQEKQEKQEMQEKGVISVVPCSSKEVNPVMVIPSSCKSPSKLSPLAKEWTPRVLTVQEKEWTPKVLTVQEIERNSVTIPTVDTHTTTTTTAAIVTTTTTTATTTDNESSVNVDNKFVSDLQTKLEMRPIVIKSVEELETGAFPLPTIQPSSVSTIIDAAFKMPVFPPGLYLPI